MSRFGGIPVEDAVPTGGRFGGVPVVDAPAPVAVVGPPPKKKKSNLLGRSMDRLETSLSDVFSTMAGDTYGRHNDPTQRDDLGVLRRGLKAVGGVALPALGEVATDVVIEGGKAVLPEAAQQAIANGAQMAAESAPVRLLGRWLDAWKQASPESYATTGELANVALAFTPVKKLPLKDFGAAKRLAKSAAKTRTAEIKNVFTPPRPITGKIPAGDFIEKPNLLRTKEFVPNTKYQAMLDEVASVPGVDPRRSATANRNVLAKAITKTKESLNDKLAGAPAIPRSDVYHAIDDAKDEIMRSPYVVGDAETAANKMSDVFDKLIEQKMVNDEIAPKDLIDVRTQFDQMIKADNPSLLTPGGSAGKVTTQKLRRSLNKLVADKVPEAGVLPDLDRMHKLLKANDYLAKVAETEGGDRFTRWLANMEARTGIKHAVNPISGSRQITDLPAMLYTGTAAALTGGAKGITEAAARNSVAAQRMLATALRESPEIVGKGLLIDATTRKKKRKEPDNAPRR